MNKHLLFVIPAVAVFLLITLLDCTTGPTAGTETGNPDITACCVSALSLFDTADQWLPSSYLVEGERQLDPGKVYTAPLAVMFAKRSAVNAADTSAPSGTNDIIVRADTIIVSDTVFVKDTIVIDTVVADTIVDSAIDGSGVNELITERIQYDSIFFVDTVIKRDTLVLQQIDSKTVTSGDTAERNMKVDYSQQADLNLSDFVVVRDSVSGAIALYNVSKSSQWEQVPAIATPLVTTIRSDSSFVLLARQFTVGGTFVSEVYRDGDGDGLLAISSAGTTARSTGIFTYRKGAMETVVEVDFDAGTDNLLRTTGDNRILALQRKGVFSDGSNEQIRYGARYFGQSGDTVILQRDCTSTADSVTRNSRRYISITGSDPYNQRENRLIACTQTVNFSSGSIKKMEITIIPAAPLTAGQLPSTGAITAVVDYGKGLTGMIDASINYSTQMITGMYAEAGIEYHLTFQQNGNILELLPIQ